MDSHTRIYPYDCNNPPRRTEVRACVMVTAEAGSEFPQLPGALKDSNDADEPLVKLSPYAASTNPPPTYETATTPSTKTTEAPTPGQHHPTVAVQGHGEVVPTILVD